MLREPYLNQSIGSFDTPAKRQIVSTYSQKATLALTRGSQDSQGCPGAGIKFQVSLLIIFLLTGCASIVTFRGVEPVGRNYDVDQVTLYGAILVYFYENDFEILSANESLGFIKARYHFRGTQTWSAATSVMSPYAEPMARAINPYGKNSFVTTSVNVTKREGEKAAVRVKAFFESWGEPQGVGGAGPFPMNSKKVWEEKFLTNIANFIPQLADQGWAPPPVHSASDAVFTGTCFAVSDTGLLLTSNHVVDNARSIEIRLADGRSERAVVEKASSSNDLALLRIQAATSGYLTLAPPRRAELGQPVFTLGFPATSILGKDHKFTDGSISALSGLGGEASFLQISVPIQPGNSGGPLLNDQGEVLGIITSTAAVEHFMKTTGSLPQNVNWAVKAEYAAPLFDPPPALPVAPNRGAAIKRAQAALCSVEARR